MKRIITFLSLLAILILGSIQPVEVAPLYQISLTNAGDVTVANDVLIHFANGPSRTEVIDRICARRGYQATIPDPNNPGQTIANPQSKGQFVLATLKQFVNDELRASIKGDHQVTADASTTTDVNAKLP